MGSCRDSIIIQYWHEPEQKTDSGSITIQLWHELEQKNKENHKDSEKKILRTWLPVVYTLSQAGEKPKTLISCKQKP